MSAKVNKTGSDCPYALKLVACQLMLEVTTFMRETYQYPPQTGKPNTRESMWGVGTGAGERGVGGCQGAAGGKAVELSPRKSRDIREEQLKVVSGGQRGQSTHG